MFVVCEWANSEQLLEDCLKMEHLCILLIQFGLGYLTGQDASSPNVFLEKTDTLLNVDERSDEDGARSGADECFDLSDRLGGLGKCFMDFLQFLTSRRFETMKLINFMHPNLGFHSILMRGQWRHLHKARSLFVL
ncbi:unnamed protein product [Anisakis simplex]|uniref:Protein kinase domain-containing protein n=1 Tax=Anisakis simplex TaxID=6269 RepID=A0A0M3KHJ3_ANISI|nr:unnamed protein product [Anisakis simplex]